jgi:hypothetical protein
VAHRAYILAEGCEFQNMEINFGSLAQNLTANLSRVSFALSAITKESPAPVSFY